MVNYQATVYFVSPVDKLKYFQWLTHSSSLQCVLEYTLDN